MYPLTRFLEPSHAPPITPARLLHWYPHPPVPADAPATTRIHNITVCLGPTSIIAPTRNRSLPTLQPSPTHACSTFTAVICHVQPPYNHPPRSWAHPSSPLWSPSHHTCSQLPAPTPTMQMRAIQSHPWFRGIPGSFALPVCYFRARGHAGGRTRLVCVADDVFVPPVQPSFMLGQFRFLAGLLCRPVMISCMK